MAVTKATIAPLHDAAARSRSRGKGAHVRAHGCASSRRRAIGEHQGQSSRHDVGETGMPGAMVFGYFLPKQKVARAVGRRGKKQRFCNDKKEQLVPAFARTAVAGAIAQ
ncbi:MAG TPA: hypothetical protein VFW60_00755 [Rhodanobacteraceae bacterium]|nr:hypothetical protein [Rhodanobacteraceae bacterium]